MYGKVLYLNYLDIDSVGLTNSEIVTLLDVAFKEKAAGKTIAPPKHWLPAKNGVWFGGMSSYIEKLNAAGMKWQSGNPRNADVGLPYILGFYILNDEEGRPVAIMDSTWITAKRTAAASSLTAQYTARKDSKTLGIIGCGVQGKAHLAAMLEIFPSLHEFKAYDIIPEKTIEYCQTMGNLFKINIKPCTNSREVVENTDILVTGGANTPEIRRGWVSPGITAISIDCILSTDTYWHPEAYSDFDFILADDTDQLEEIKQKGYFSGMPNFQGDLAEIVGGIKQARKTPQDRIIAFNMGVSIEDLPTAKEIYQRAREKHIGTWLTY